MSEKIPPFKKPSKKHQPQGLTILYEDRDILVVNKVNGLLTISTEREREKTAYFLLTDYVKKGNPRSKSRIFIVHRLDRDTSGILVFAKTERVKRFLQDNWADFSKTYIAVAHGVFSKKEDVISSYLLENSMHVMYSSDDTKRGQFAKTGYKVLRESTHFSLLEIHLFTGKKNQIRVHLSEMGHPVAGDKMYGKAHDGVKRLALHAASLTIVHPFTKKEMTFEAKTPLYFKALLKMN